MSIRKKTVFILFSIYCGYLPFYCQIIGGDGLPQKPKIIATANKNKLDAQLALDGRKFSRWTTNSEQVGGEWFLIDLREKQEILSVILDTSFSNRDYPRDYKIEISTDKKTFVEIKRTKSLAPSPIIEMQFNKDIGRYIKITQLGKAKEIYWSIHEIEINSNRLVEKMPYIKRWKNFIKLACYGLLLIIPFFAIFRNWQKIKEAPLGLIKPLGIVFILFLNIAPFLPNDFFWGLQQMKSFPVYINMLTSAIILVLSFELIAYRLISLLEILIANLSKLASFFVPTIFATFMTIISWLLRTNKIYGDGGATINIMESGKQIINGKEPLDRLITTLTYQFLNGHFDISAKDTIAIISCSAGFIYWLTCFYIAKTLTGNQKYRIVTLLLLISPGVTQVFYGNIENYSLLGAGIMLYLYLALKSIAEKKRPYYPALVLGTTIGIHMSAVCLLPSLMALCLLITANDKLRSIIISFLIILGCLLITFSLVWLLSGDLNEFSLENFGGGDRSLTVPLFEVTSMYHKYTLFSINHIVDIINEILLIAPIAFLMSIILSYKFIQQGNFFSIESSFLLICFICCFLYLFLFNPDMAIFDVGILNEWDLLSPIAYPIMLLSVYLLNKETNDQYIGSFFFIAVCSLFSTAYWILSNKTYG